MFCDEAVVKLIAGRGGDGMVSFRREKYVSKGGPDGGDGGKGGDIIFRTSLRINTLSKFLRGKVFRAENAQNGHRYRRHGADAENLYLEVPVGTIIYNADTDEEIVDFNKPGLEYELVKGGRGGFGNAHFTSSVRQAPQFSELGDRGEEVNCRLSLKLVADVGLVGLPSVGKSTLISRVSRAKPKIAAYHFTTIIPNLGVVDFSKFDSDEDASFVVADMPGLIQGASEGKGLGDQFLRHISRTKILIHILDVTNENIVQDYQTIRDELGAFDADLLNKPELIALNKIDAIDGKQLKKKISEIKSVLLPNTAVYKISGVTGEGIKDLMLDVLKLLEKSSNNQEIIQSEEIYEKVYRPHIEDERRFEVIKLQKGLFEVKGKRIEQIARMTDFQNQQALARIYDVMAKRGILKSLKKEGAVPGDKIQISGKILEYLG